MPEQLFGREPVTLVEIDQDFCSLSFGAGACTAGRQHSGTAQAGAAGTITLAADAATDDNVYASMTVRTTGGTGSGQERVIGSYVGSTKVATVTANWSTTPDNTTTYDVINRPQACFNTFASCQDPENFDRGSKTIRFCKPLQRFNPDWRAVPSVAGVSASPGRISAGAQSSSSGPLGQRAGVTVGFVDHPGSDIDFDPYLASRSYDPLERGTFWTKWLARNPYFQNRPLRVRHGYADQASYLNAPGASGDYASAVAPTIAGDRLFIAGWFSLTDWTPAAINRLIGQWFTTPNQRSYHLSVLVAGTLQLQVTADGATAETYESSVAPTVSGDKIYLAVDWLGDNGASNSEARFYTSTDGRTLTQLGTTRTGSVLTIHAGTAALTIAATNAGTQLPMTGKVYYAEIREGRGNPIVASFDPARARVGDRTFTSRHGQQWKIFANAALTGQPESWQLPAQHYVMDSLSGPDAQGNVQIKAVDVLRLADDIRAQAPALSTGELTASLSDSATSFSVTGADLADYESAGTVRIGDEVMTYTTLGESPAGTLNFSGVTRGTDGTTAATHDEDEIVQRCLRYTSERPVDVIQDLLENHAGIDAELLDLTAWSDENDVWLIGLELTALITEPEGVATLIGEICEQVLVFLWWDDRAQLVRLRALRTPIEEPEVFNESDHLLLNSLSFRLDPPQRISQLWVYFQQKNPTEKLDEPGNFSRARIRIDADAEGENEYDEQRIKKIYSRWLSTDAQVNDVGTRLLARYRDNPVVGSMMLDAKDRALWTGDLVRLQTRLFVDFTGEQKLRQFQVIGAEEVTPGEQVKYDLQNYETQATRSGRYTEDSAPDYDDADETELATLAWYAQDDGFMPDGEEGYAYQ